jgi:hypothetical protein
VPLALLGVYGALLVGTAVEQPVLMVEAVVVLAGAYGLSWFANIRGRAGPVSMRG